MMLRSRLPEPLTVAGLPTPHGFFTREGGVSQGPFATLNCNLSGRDVRESVLENRARAARAIGARPERLVGLAQVHGATVVTVTEPWQAGAGPSADAMVTDRAGIALGIITADCAPVLLLDPAAGVIGAAHAGWRGAVAGIIQDTVEAMIALGARPDRLRAAVGPCIGQRSYEVAADVRDAVISPHPAGEGFFQAGRREGRWMFDLAGYCQHRLQAAGVAGTEWIDADTAADGARFFSHRRRTLAGGGPIGHQISVIALPA
jgi:YfiH family protein